MKNQWYLIEEKRGGLLTPQYFLILQEVGIGLIEIKKDKYEELAKLQQERRETLENDNT